MPDQVKYTQKLKDAKVLVIGGSSGVSIKYILLPLDMKLIRT